MSAGTEVTSGSWLSGDVSVKITAHPRPSIMIISQVGEFAEREIRRIVVDVLAGRRVQGLIEIQDNAAADWVVRARLITAVRRWNAAQKPEGASQK